MTFELRSQVQVGGFFSFQTSNVVSFHVNMSACTKVSTAVSLFCKKQIRRSLKGESPKVKSSWNQWSECIVFHHVGKMHHKLRLMHQHRCVLINQICNHDMSETWNFVRRAHLATVCRGLGNLRRFMVFMSNFSVYFTAS